MAVIRLEVEVWCSDPAEFENLMSLIRRGHVLVAENGTSGGYGYEINVQDISEERLRRELGFKKSECCE